MKFYDSSNIPAGLVQEDFRAALLRLNPAGGSPLFALSGIASTTQLHDIERGWWTKRSIFQNMTVNAGGTVAAGTTALVVTAASAAEARAGLVIRHKASGNAPELMLITAVATGTNTLTVIRGFASTTAATIPDSTVLQCIGNANEQGSLAPAPVSVLPTRYVNQTQIFRDGWDLTGTLAAIKTQVGDGTVTESKRDSMFFHGSHIERSIIFGRKGVTVFNGAPMTTMAGIEQIIEDHAPGNVTEAGATTSFEQIENMLEPLLNTSVDGSLNNTRDIYCGSQALKVFNQIGKASGEYQITDGMTSFGLQFRSFKTTRGTFRLHEHAMLNSNTDWSKMAIILDLASLELPHLRKTKHVAYGEKEQAGRDAEGGIYTTELTVELTNPEGCGIIYGLTRGVA